MIEVGCKFTKSMNQKIITHPELVRNLFKPGEDILASLDPLKCEILHAALAIPGEAGELVDAIKKFVVYLKPLDRANVVEELGDLEFFLEALRVRLDITREETIEANIAKLEKRYHGGSYSDRHAQQRADKTSE